MIYKLLSNGDVLQLHLKNNLLKARVVREADQPIGSVYSWILGKGKMEIIDIRQTVEQGFMILYRNRRGELRRIGLMIVGDSITYFDEEHWLQDVVELEKDIAGIK